MGRTGLVWEPRCLLHQCGLGHPERPQRLEAIRNGLEQAELWQRCEHLAARPASTRELLRCHTESYLELVHKEVAAGREDLSTGDTSLSAHTEEAARLAAGGALVAVEAAAPCLREAGGRRCSVPCRSTWCLPRRRSVPRWCWSPRVSMGWREIPWPTFNSRKRMWRI